MRRKKTKTKRMNICDEQQKKNIHLFLSECPTYLVFGSGSSNSSGLDHQQKKNNHVTQPYSMHFRSVQKFQSFSSVLQSNSIRIDYYYDCVHMSMLLYSLRFFLSGILFCHLVSLAWHSLAHSRQ